MRKSSSVPRRIPCALFAALHLAATLALADEPASSEPALGLVVVDPAARGLSLYREGEYVRAAEALETSRRERPDDAEAALLSGLIQLRLDAPAEAARQWRDAIRLSRGARWAEDLRGSLTLVAREADRRDARAAFAPGATPETREDRLAILPFRAEAATDLDPLARALSTFLAVNLGARAEGTVVDPDRVDVFLALAGDATSATTEGTASRRVARSLGAGRVVIGTLASVGQDRLRLEAELFDSATERAIGRFDAEASSADFQTLVPTLATALAERLGGASDSVGTVHTKDVEAATAFGRARELFANDDFPAARDELERALGADADFRLARELASRLPAAAVSLVAVANSVESTIVPTIAKEKGGGGPSRRTLLLLGGAAVAAGAAGIALAVGGGGGGGGDADDGGAPTLEGVADGNVAVGDVFRLDVTGRDPGGSDVTLVADLTDVQPGATFTILSDTGATKTGRLEYRPSIGDIGVHSVTFTVRLRNDSSKSASETARITVSAGAAVTPTPDLTPIVASTPTATRTRTPSPTPTASPTP